jgi:hypothetical protein
MRGLIPLLPLTSLLSLVVGVVVQLLDHPLPEAVVAVAVEM